jgi:hypothetical protein
MLFYQAPGRLAAVLSNRHKLNALDFAARPTSAPPS